MTPFPVTNSTLSGFHLAQLLHTEYAFQRDTSCIIFRTGINDSYMVQSGSEKYVLRVYSYGWRSELEIQEEIALLNLLATENLPVSKPVQSNSGGYIQHINAPEGLRFAVLFTFVEGKKVRNLSEYQCHRIGEIMAKMHSITVGKSVKRIQYDTSSLLHIPYQTASKFFDHSLKEMQFVKDMSAVVCDKFDKADKPNFRSGIVHLDIWYDNMNITEESKISLFDFDFCGNGWLILDVAYFAMQLFHTEPDKDAYRFKLEHFLEGYQKTQPMSADEMRMLPYAGFAVWIFYLGVQASRFDNWSNIFFTENYLKHFIGLSKNWLKFHDIDPEKIV